MSDVSDTREWARHAARWKGMVRNLKSRADFLAWYTIEAAKITTVEADTEVQLKLVERSDKAFLELI